MENGFEDKNTLSLLNQEECDFMQLKEIIYDTKEYESMYIPEALVFSLLNHAETLTVTVFEKRVPPLPY